MQEQDLRDSLAAFGFTHVYVIYGADVTSDSESFIDRMSPARHILAGWSKSYRPKDRVHAAEAAGAFTETEGNDAYEFSYLASETGNPRFRGVDDESEMKCERCGAVLVYSRKRESHATWDDGPEDIDWTNDSSCPDEFLDPAADYTGANAGEDMHQYPGRGRHRKWTAELTRNQWTQFAYVYGIGLDDNGIPEEFELTGGSITEHGHLDAISVDNSGGWDDESGEVITSSMYLSFGRNDPESEQS